MRVMLDTYILDELRDVVIKKFPKRSKKIENILSELSYELVENITSKKQFKITDPKDIPGITGAINGRVDVLITRDKDFEEVRISNLKIIKPSEYQIIN